MSNLEEKMASMPEVYDDYNKDLYSYHTDLRSLLDRGYEFAGVGRLHFPDMETSKKATISDVVDFVNSYKKFRDACQEVLEYGCKIKEGTLEHDIAMVRTVMDNRVDAILNSNELDLDDICVVFASFKAATETIELWSKLQDEINKVSKECNL